MNEETGREELQEQALDTLALAEEDEELALEAVAAFPEEGGEPPAVDADEPEPQPRKEEHREEAPLGVDMGREEGLRGQIERFTGAFPQVKAEEIPQDIWQAYKAGGDLASLYAVHENRQLKERLSRLEQQEKNRARSTGSRKSAGNRSFRSLLEQLWYEDD